MKTTKILALVLALATVLSLASFGAFADEVTFEYLYEAEAITTLGDHNITPLDTVDVTGYCFTPDAAGVYEITLKTPGAALHNVGGSPFFATYDSLNEEGVITFEVSESGVGGSCLFGIQYNGTAVVNIALAEDQTPGTQEYPDWIIYQNTVAPQSFTLQLAEGEALSYVSVYEEHSAVRGEDGFYHLDEANGPVLYVNLARPPYSFVEILAAGAVRDYFFDADGNFINRIDYTNAVTEFINCADNNIYPLCYDLMHIISTHGENQGWFDADGTNCWFNRPETMVEDTAWMYACCYVPAEEGDDDSSENSIEDGDDTINSADDSLPAEDPSESDAPVDDSVQGGNDISEDGNASEDSADAPVVEPSLGDVSFDGEINSLDAAQVLKYDALMVEFSEDQLLCGDVNGDASVDSLDAAQILKLDAGLITEFSGVGTTDDEPIYGTEDNPHTVIAGSEYVVAPGETVYFELTYKNGMMFTATAGEFEESFIVVDLVQSYFFTNTTDDTVVLYLDFASPAGYMDNPIELVMGENTVSVSAGSQGVYYKWIATANGTLTIEMPDGDWFYCINNLTSYIYGDNCWSDDDPATPVATVEVSEGDEIQLLFNTYDPANMWENPAGELIVVASFE